MGSRSRLPRLCFGLLVVFVLLSSCSEKSDTITLKEVSRKIVELEEKRQQTLDDLIKKSQTQTKPSVLVILLKLTAGVVLLITLYSMVIWRKYTPRTPRVGKG
jgi:hypothetical protein